MCSWRSMLHNFVLSMTGLATFLFVMLKAGQVTPYIQTAFYQSTPCHVIPNYRVVSVPGSFPTYLSCAICIAMSDARAHAYNKLPGLCQLLILSSSNVSVCHDGNWTFYLPGSPTTEKTRTLRGGSGVRLKKVPSPTSSQPSLPSRSPSPTSPQSSLPSRSLTLTFRPSTLSSTPPSQTSRSPSPTSRPPTLTSQPPTLTSSLPTPTSTPPSQTSTPPSQTSRSPSPTSRPPTPTSRPPSPTSRLPTLTSRLPTPTSRLATSTSRLPSQTSRLPSQTSRLPSQTSRPPTLTESPKEIDLVIMTTHGYVLFYNLDTNRALFEERLDFPAITHMEYWWKQNTLLLVIGGQMTFVSPITKATEKYDHKGRRVVSFWFDIKKNAVLLQTQQCIHMLLLRGKEMHLCIYRHRHRHRGILDMEVCNNCRTFFVSYITGSSFIIRETSYRGRSRTITYARAPATSRFAVSKNGKILYFCSAYGLTMRSKGRPPEGSNQLSQQSCSDVTVTSKMVWAVFSKAKEIQVFQSSTTKRIKRIPIALPMDTGARWRLQIFQKRGAYFQ